MSVEARSINEFIQEVTESIQEINDDSWIIGNRLLLSRQPSPISGSSWSDGTGSFYVISDAPNPLPPSRPLPATSNIQLVYSAGVGAGGGSAVWRVGDAFCKVKTQFPSATREHVTLDYLRNKPPLSFAIPSVHYHAEYDGRYYIITSRLTDQTLTEAWPNMDEAMKQHFVSRTVSICKELAVWQADSITGVDGQHLTEFYLTSSTRDRFPHDCSPRNLLKNCKEVGMDCSTFVFFHCDLGPGNIIVNLTEGSIGIIDWETAGFVPKEWIMTKFRVGSGLDLPGDDLDSRVDWRRRVMRYMKKEGFSDVAERYETWFGDED